MGHPNVYTSNRNFHIFRSFEMINVLVTLIFFSAWLSSVAQSHRIGWAIDLLTAGTIESWAKWDKMKQITSLDSTRLDSTGGGVCVCVCVWKKMKSLGLMSKFIWGQRLPGLSYWLPCSYYTHISLLCLKDKH